MTRRIKTWRSTSELIEALRNWSFDPFRVRYRRQPKGRRAKSGQWWRRTLPPMTFMELADYSFRQSEKNRSNEP